MAAKNFTPIDNPVSKPKEAEPVLEKPEAYEIQEVVEHEVTDEELRPHVALRKETIKLPPDLKKLGLQSASTTAFPSYQSVKTPLADDKILTGLHAPVTSSLRWLATLAWYLLRKAHVTLKIIHGKVVRIFKN